MLPIYLLYNEVSKLTKRKKNREQINHYSFLAQTSLRLWYQS